MSDETKAVVSVSEMARMVSLSRARFYQLVRAGTFPAPAYHAGRPVYTEEMQQTCLEVRRRNCGIDGKPVLFYARRAPRVPAPARKRARPTKATNSPSTPGGKNKDIAALVDGLCALGLTTVTGSQVEAVAKELYPDGTSALDQAEVLRAIFLRLKRQNTRDNVGR